MTLGKRIGLYKFRGELGTGNFSRVKLGFHQLAHGNLIYKTSFWRHHTWTGIDIVLLLVERVAVKIMEKTGMDQKALKMLTREIANMDTVRHPAIVR